jgi:hypothetical protein
MKKFYVSASVVDALEKKHDDFTALRAILEDAMKMAGTRILAVPALRGEYLPCIFGRVPNVEVLPRPKFERERAEAFAALRQAREDYEARQADRRDRHAERFLGTRPRGQVLTAVEFEARQRERLQREARVAQNRAARNAECQERRGAAGQGGGKGKKGKAA